ncbi:DNA helicase RecQ [Pelagibius sp.]|uniref:DNA helicase RecQ n=1 Tax=Pelagibius sp. TaxID=1931238 RepID=UPI003B507144
MSDQKALILKDVFGFDSFRPGQAEIIDTLLGGRSALAVMPTGAGKSLCFQVPALARGGLTIVVSPLVALMQDQVAALRLAGVEAETINSARPRAENVDSWRRIAAGETRLLYLAPERLMTERMLAALKRLDVRLIAVDEAHCISQWGPAFRPEYEDLAQLREIFPGVPIAALTATADATTRNDIVDKLFGGDAESFVLGFDRPNLQLGVEVKQQWKNQLMAFLQRHDGVSGIVYCLSRRKTEEAAAFLVENGIKALAYHAGMDKEARDANQNVFMTEDGVVMVATIAFGMGIDKPDVRFVFHCDLPASVEAYYQEIGRAGRDGLPAEAQMLYGLDDIRMRRVFIEQEESSDDRRRREHQRLDALIGYCESPTCRRRLLLDYFGEDLERCGNCDLCRNPVDLSDGTAEGRQILAVIEQTGQRFGVAHIVDILRGTATEKVVKAGHDNLAGFGAGADGKKEAWRSLIRQLVAAGFLQLDIAGYGGLKITAKGRALLTGTEAFHYRPDRVAAHGRTPRARKQAPETALTPEENSLLGRLKELRLRLAKERGVPAYVIFPDKALADMARRRPRSHSEFAAVNGVGTAKLRDFADVFLGEIADAG